MAEINGKLIICDRCGDRAFVKTTGEGEADGGYTRWNKFEPAPKGWDLIEIPAESKRHHYIRVCPACHALWTRILNESFLEGTELYIHQTKED